MKIGGARARYGLDGKLIDFGRQMRSGRARFARRDARICLRLKSRSSAIEREIEHIERIMREGTGADRQLMVWERTQDMKAVVDQIVAETNEGLAV